MSAEPAISLSVLIATHNRRDKLQRCLETLAAQDGETGAFEVIVALDGGEDGSAELAEGFEGPFELRPLRLPKGGKSAALNAAIELARGSVVVFLDDDVLASPRLVAEHLTAHREDPRTLGIGLLTQPQPPGGDWFGRAHAAAWNERYAALAERPADWPDTYGGNFSAPTESLRRIGGFAVDLTAIEDVELGYRLVEDGCRPRFLAAAAGIHDDHKPRQRLLGDVVTYGEFCARFAESKESARPRLLGWFLETTAREQILRRAMLALRVPPTRLAALGGGLPGAGRKQLWFGFVNRYAFWLGARRGMGRARWRQTTRGVPVLMYHAFSESEEHDRYVLSRAGFARQLRALRLLRYRAVSFEELAQALREGVPLPPRAVVITIDDGYRDNLEVALPLLRRYRFRANLYLVSARFGGVNDWTPDGAVAHRPLLSAEQAKAMRDQGIVVGAHTRTHPSLPEVADVDLDVEIGGSKSDLEQLFGEPVRTFAYPYGRFDERAVEAVRRAGFDAACTTDARLARIGEDPLRIPRLEVTGSESLPSFLRKLWFGAL